MTNLLLVPCGPGELVFEELLKAGRQACEDLACERALDLFKQAALAEPGRLEPWIEMENLYRRFEKWQSASDCHFLVCKRVF
jgi:hypothetical protein